MSKVLVERTGSVAILTLNDPDKRNILSLELCRSLSAAVKAAEQDADVKAIVVTGAAPAFCAGADLDDLDAASRGDTENVHAVYQSFMDVANCTLPTIAAVNGAAVGAGLNLALACDTRIASETALFDTRFLKIGLHPGGGHSWMLLRAVGWAQATRLLLLAQQMRTQEALSIGLVQQVVAPDALLDSAIALAQSADRLPRELIVATKASMRVSACATHADSFAHETEQQMLSLSRPPFRELVDRLRASIEAKG